MSIESATYISQLNSSLPASSDPRSEGDDHLKLIKAVLKATFPNISGAVTASQSDLNAASTVRNGSWVLQASTTVSGTPSTVEFLNGTDGVVISAAYDEYLIDFNWIRPSSSAILRLEGTSNGGSGWTALGSLTAQSLMVSSGTVTGATQGASAMRLTGSKSVSSTANNEASGQVSIVQHDQGSIGAVKVHGWVVHGTGLESCHTIAGSAALEAGLGTQLNGFRLSWSTGTFANTSGVIRLFSRKLS